MTIQYCASSLTKKPSCQLSASLTLFIIACIGVYFTAMIRYLGLMIFYIVYEQTAVT